MDLITNLLILNIGWIQLSTLTSVVCNKVVSSTVNRWNNHQVIKIYSREGPWGGDWNEKSLTRGKKKDRKSWGEFTV